MRAFLHPFSISTVVLLAGSIRAEPGEIAELFPGEPLLYVEVSRPGAVAAELLDLFKGSALENPKPFFEQIGRRSWKDGELGDRSETEVLATLLGPAMLNEARKFAGLAFAVTGFRADGSTDFVALVKPGESKLPHKLIGSLLGRNSQLKKSLNFEGVDVFQDDGPAQFPIELPQGGAISQPASIPRLALAQTSEMVIVASSKEQVVMVLKRMKAKEKSPSFASSEAFKEIVPLRKQPGILISLDARELAARVERSARSGKATTPTAWVAIKELLPPAAVKTITAHLSLSSRSIRCSVALTFVSGKKVPLLEFLDDQSIGMDQLATLTSESPAGLAVAFPKGERRLNAVLGVVNAVVKSTGTLGPTATELLDELVEKRYQPDPRQTFGKISGLTLLLPSPGNSRSTALPTILLHTDDNETPGHIEKLLPAICEIIAGELPQPVTETIAGQKIRSVATSGMTLHYGFKENRFAMGGDRQSLANALIAKKSPPAPKDGNLFDGAMTLRLNWPELLRNGANRERSAPSVARSYKEIIIDGPLRRAGPAEMPVDVAEQLNLLPPSWFTLHRQGAVGIRVEWEQSAAQAGFAKLISGGFAWYSRFASADGRYEFDGIDPLIFIKP